MARENEAVKTAKAARDEVGQLRGKLREKEAVVRRLQGQLAAYEATTAGNDQELAALSNQVRLTLTAGEAITLQRARQFLASPAAASLLPSYSVFLCFRLPLLGLLEDKLHGCLTGSPAAGGGTPGPTSTRH